MTKHLACVAALGMFGFMAQAQTAADQSANRLAGADSTWARKAAQGGMAEVKLGELAKENASNEAVKKFGQQMVDDHSKAGDELKSIAGKKGITLPSDMDAKDQATYDRLSKLKGDAFDRAYMADMLRDHRADIAEFKREAARGADADLKAFASKTLPTLEHHLQMAQEAESKVKK